MRMYQIRFCDPQTDDDLSLYFSYPPTYTDILRCLLAHEDYEWMVDRCTLLLASYSQGFPDLKSCCPSLIQSLPTGFIEFNLIEVETQESLLVKSARCRRLYKERQRLFDEAYHLYQKAQEITGEIQAEMNLTTMEPGVRIDFLLRRTG
jgi:hypothetical protein